MNTVADGVEESTLTKVKSFSGKVAVLCGGSSAEREISLQSGRAVYQAMLEKGLNAELVDMQDWNIEQLKRFDVAFIALHGRGGEDGCIQGALELAGIPYTGSGVMASALAMDKGFTKQMWAGNNIPTPGFWVVTSLEDSEGIDVFPLMVKPAHEGSSIGMRKVKNRNELRSAISYAKEFDERVLVESWVDGPEYTVGVLNSKALPVIRLDTPHEFYDYDAKYLATDTQYICPCGLSEKQEKDLQALALDAFNAVGCEGWGRVDVMLDAKYGFLCLEVNTVPGMTDHSLVPMAAKAEGFGFADLVEKILLGAICETV